jgi:quercetin dioxygenase-like cupin family protein
MRLRSFAVAAAAAAVLASPSFASAQAAAAGTIKEAFREPVVNIPGKSLVGVLVSYPPGGSSPAHRHPASSFITAYVLSGAVKSQVNDGQPKVYRAGEHWIEPPGAHHQVSANASATEPASLLAVFVVDTADADKLVTFDPR